MPGHPPSALIRVGELLVRRRIDLDPRYRVRRVFTNERAPDLYRIINDLELGKRDNYDTKTLAAVEAAYKLAPGSIGRALDGGELDPSPPPAAQDGNGQADLPDDAEVIDLVGRFLTDDLELMIWNTKSRTVEERLGEITALRETKQRLRAERDGENHGTA